MRRFLRSGLGGPAFGLVLFLVASAPVASRADLIFDVTVNTTALVGNPAGPFQLDFQLTDGGQPFLAPNFQFDDPNFVNLTNFNFHGGSPLGAPTLIGSATGNLATQVHINDLFFDPMTMNFVINNEFIQSFVAGNLLTFHVDLSTNFIKQLTNNLPPDQFSFSILNAAGIPIDTTDPTGLGRLIVVDINSANPPVQVFQGISPVVSVVAIVPTPAALPMSIIPALLGLAVSWRWRRRPHPRA